MKLKPEILFEDDHLVVIHKPANYLTIPDRFKLDKPNCYAYLNQKYGKVFTVHRLDKETSGLLVFARTESAHRTLSLDFQRRKIGKIYLALVDGNIHHEEGRIEAPLEPHPFKAGEMRVSHKNGKASLTEYKVIERFRQYDLVEVNLKTGRTHQIRVHFAYLGHPLAVDSTYGNSDGFYLSKVKKKYNIGKYEEERPLMSRVTLHATGLEFNHPETEEVMRITSDLPKDFRAVLNQLRKWGQ